MSSNKKTVWTEGMFLRPQHFQQQERFFCHWVEARCSSLRAFSWGFTELLIDQEKQAFGKVSLNVCQGIFPDGTPFNAPHEQSPPPILEVGKMVKQQLVYLALPLPLDGRKEVAFNKSEAGLSRYYLAEQTVKDNSTDIPADDAVIGVGELLLSLRLESQDNGSYVIMPVARIVEVKPDGRVILDKDLISPVLFCRASETLKVYLEEVQGLLHHRAEMIAKRLGAPDTTGVAEIVDFLMLQIINRYDSLFKHLAVTADLHPEDFYQLLLQMLGELSTITEESHRPRMHPEYAHDNLAMCISPIMGSLRQALNWEPDLRAASIPLEQHKFGIQTALVDQESLRSAELILAVSAEVAEKQIRDQLPQQVTVAPKERLRDLVVSHTTGILLQPLNNAPRQIPFHAGFTYFKLDRHTPLWSELEKSGALAFHFAGEYPGLKTELWVIKA